MPSASGRSCATFRSRSTLAAELDALRSAGVGFIGVEHSAVDAVAVAQAQRAGIGLGAWTVNDPADIQRMIDLGIDMLITDEPELAMQMTATQSP